MSWLFSRALAGEFSAGSCSGGEPSVPSSEIPTPLAYCSHGKMTERLPHSLSGMTFAHLTDDRGAALLTSYLEGFRAKTLASPAKALVYQAHAAGYGQNSPESLARFYRDSYSWKTHQLSLLEDSASCLVTFSRSGTMRDGALYQLQMPELRTVESESGLLPTPTAQSYGSNRGGSVGRVGKMWPTPQSYSKGNSKSMPGLTPLDLAVRPEMEKHRVRAIERRRGEPMRQFQTPTVCGNYNSNGSSAKSGEGLAPVGGKLNPTWVEWLMGWPLGWTGLEPLETDRFRLWLASHGRS
jgi:hypothetical protein